MAMRSARSISSSMRTKCLSTWINKLDAYLLGTEPVKDQHSKMLAKSDLIYNLEIHDVKPGHMKEYLTNAKQIIPAIHESDTVPAKLFGQFAVAYGQTDRIYTIWKYDDGYKGLQESNTLCRKDSEYTDYVAAQAKLLNKREQQICYEFSFWPDYVDNYDGGIFEIRTYNLRPGCLYEWCNAWASGIPLREKDAVMGLSSQIGEMYTVHHIWRYGDMVKRKEERDLAWKKGDWGDCVIKTVPLIKTLNVNIIIPTDFSPLR